MSRLSRRQALALTIGAPLMVRLMPASATPGAMQAAIASWSKGAAIEPGLVTLTLPLLVASGNAVPLKVTVDSPMTPEDHVAEIAIFNERNPLPDVIRFHFTPASGRAQAETRIRLSDTQKVHAIARLSDGTFRSAAVNVVVTAPACVEN
ncbi:thiosulfate oxidation carrier protein SoxY [Mesorhizobium sp. KR2-14]|uniref:thiosulfate oxidation carrier protein SoxY n=1 Tax=Mesorhizobium sp. KR2-14 TaxID=3156610 RepID=UPI0032B5DFC4